MHPSLAMARWLEDPSMRSPSLSLPLNTWRLVAMAWLLAGAPAWAGDRLLATSGVSQVEGAAGGGLTPWAVIGGHGSSDQVGASAYATHIRTQGKFNLNIQGVAVGVKNRVEVSMARWSFKFSDTVPGKSAQMNVLGAKVRVLGDAVYDQDVWWPQVSVGFQHKHNEGLRHRLVRGRHQALVGGRMGAQRAGQPDFARHAGQPVWHPGLWWRPGQPAPADARGQPGGAAARRPGRGRGVARQA